MAAFLTRFTRAKIWEDYPWLLSCAVGDLEDDLILTLKGYNVADTLLATNQSTATSFTDSVVSFDVSNVYGTFQDSLSYMTAWVESTTGEVLTDTLTIDVVHSDDICSNPIMVMGRNSLGGVLQWMFDYNQEYSFDYGNNIKAKRLILNTNDLIINEWEALQDLITLGPEYRVSITEFTSSTIKSNARIGQQIYVVSNAGVKTGVLVLPTRNKTLTKQIKNTFEVEIEYPEVFTA